MVANIMIVTIISNAINIFFIMFFFFMCCSFCNFLHCIIKIVKLYKADPLVQNVLYSMVELTNNYRQKGKSHSIASGPPPRCCYNPHLTFSVTSVMNSKLVSLKSSRSYKIVCNSLVPFLSAFPIAVRIARSTFCAEELYSSAIFG